MDSEFGNYRPQPVGNRIKIARVQLGLAQTDAARKAGISSNYLSLIERGKKIPSLKTLSRLASVLEIPMASLIQDDQLIADLTAIVRKYDVEAIVRGLQKIVDPVKSNDN